MRAFQPVAAIAPEGWLVLALLAACAFASYGVGLPGVAALLVLPALPLAYFFADRARSVQAHPRGVLAPVDGVVVYRRECHDPVLRREAIRIGLRVDFWGAYSLRSPVEGEVVDAAPDDDGVSVLCTDEDQEVVLRLASGSLFGARPVWVPVGERLGQGRRCGLRRLARGIDLYLPAAARVEVQLGSRVRCGETLIATLLRKT